MSTITRQDFMDTIKKFDNLKIDPNRIIIHSSAAAAFRVVPKKQQWLDTGYVYAPYTPNFVSPPLKWRVTAKERVAYLNLRVRDGDLDFGKVVNAILRLTSNWRVPGFLLAMTLPRIMRELETPNKAIRETILGLMGDLRKYTHGPLRRKIDSELVYNEL